MGSDLIEEDLRAWRSDGIFRQPTRRKGRLRPFGAPRSSEALADAMQRDLENPALIRVMGPEGRRLAVERFDENRTFEKKLFPLYE